MVDSFFLLSYLKTFRDVFFVLPQSHLRRKIVFSPKKMTLIHSFSSSFPFLFKIMRVYQCYYNFTDLSRLSL